MGPAGARARERAGPGRRCPGRVPLLPALRTYGAPRPALPARVYRVYSAGRTGQGAQRVAAAFLMAVAKVETSV
ncbi:hypothetical protein EDD91_5557 [Streptomyces sp. KS 21]|nr:hypothetical protein EDD91_5557 [Streptomyces sp. KS 21]